MLDRRILSNRSVEKSIIAIPFSLYTSRLAAYQDATEYGFTGVLLSISELPARSYEIVTR